MSGKLRSMASIYILQKDKILLLFRQGGSVVNNVWVPSAGGHFDESELNNAKKCALRELNEEIGLSENMLGKIEMRYITLRRINGEVRQNYYFFAQLNKSDAELSSNEGILKWFDISKIDTLEMPYTAKYVLQHYVKIGRHNNMLYGGISDGNQVVFTELCDY